MRVDVVSNLYPPAVVGGAERSAELLVQGLTAQGCQVRVITLAVPGAEQPRKGVVELPNPNPYWAYDEVDHPRGARMRWHISDLVSTKAVPGIRQAMHESTPDLVLTQNATGVGLRSLRAARAAAPGALFVHTLRDYSLSCVRTTRYKSPDNCTRTCLECVPRTLATGRSMSLWDGVVGVSQAVIDVHRGLGLFEGKPYRVIANAGSVAAAPELHRDRVPGSLGYLGRISEDKGVYDLLRALRRLLEAGVDVPPLLVAGEASTEESRRFERESAGLPVHRLGWVAPTVLLSQCEWLVVPSRWREPFGRVVLEAAQHDVGLVVSRAGGLPEAVQASGRNDAIFYEPGDVAELSTIVSSLSGFSHGPGTAPTLTPQQVAGEYLAFAEALLSGAAGISTDG